MATKVFTRRQVLRGLGGISVGLPFLPSLVPGPAYGQDATLAPQRRFIALCTNHGGVYESAMFPSESLLTETTTAHPGHQIRRGNLRRDVAADRASVSSVLSARADLLTEQLVSKMNVLWGLDIPFYIAHHTGGHLGNYARNDEGALGNRHVPTIDQLMAFAPSFYPDLTGVSTRSVAVGDVRDFSYGYSTPGDRSSVVTPQYTYGIAREAFDQLFPNPPMPGDDDADQRPPIVDRLMGAYRSLRQSNRRLSSADRQRLDDHVARLAELERRLNTTLDCDVPVQPNYSDAWSTENHALLVDVISTAVVCGATRIAVLSPKEELYVPYDGDWHQDVAHQWDSPGPQQQLQQANRAVFEQIFVPLARALEVEDSPGRTALDDSLLVWSQESGETTHDARSIPVVTFGGAGGTLRTGQFCDYRNRRDSSRVEAGYTGLLYNQWLATQLRALGLPPAEWQSIDHVGPTGYGIREVGDAYAPTHVNGVLDTASDWLPYLRA